MGFVNRQKWVLLSISLIISAIVGFGIWIMSLNNGPNDDLLMWFEVIIIGILINLVSALMLMAFFNDRDKKNEEKRKRYVIQVITVNNRKIKEAICNLHQDFSGKVFPDGESMEIFLNGVMTGKNVFLNYDYSKPCKFYNKVGSQRTQNGNWIEFLYFLFGKGIQSINVFLPEYFQFLSIELYNEIYDFTAKMVSEVFVWEQTDTKIITASTYSPNQDNSKIFIINLLPSILERIFKIEEYLIKE